MPKVTHSYSSTWREKRLGHRVAHEGAVIAAVMYLQHKDPADPYGPSLQQQVLSPKDSGVNEILTNASRVIRTPGTCQDRSAFR